jgi:hypothetical protein
MTDWDTFSSLTPINKWILLWFVGDDAPEAAQMPVLGQISSHAPGMVWDGHIYRPMEWFSHWAPLPEKPHS